MKEKPINIISFDGLHNVGKSTQLEIVKEELGKIGVHSIIRRGDGSRKGLGLIEEDPLSDWWQEKFSTISNAGTTGPAAESAAAMASRRLSQEILRLRTVEYPDIIQNIDCRQGVILLNRGPVSRLFVARRYNPNISYEKALNISNNPQLQTALPDNIYVLHTEKEILLERNKTRIEGGEYKRRFNENILNNYYDDFSKTLNNLPESLSERVNIIDADRTVGEINRIIMSLILSKLGNNNE